MTSTLKASKQEETGVSEGSERSLPTESSGGYTPPPRRPGNNARPSSFSAKWTAAISGIESRITAGLRVISRHAASHPRKYVVGILVLSLGLVATGIFTNFNVDTNDDTLWTPAGSKPIVHSEWIAETLPPTPRPFLIMVHSKGDNAVTHEGAIRTFQALDAIRELDNYHTVCATNTSYVNHQGNHTCNIEGITSFWNDTTGIFEASVQSTDDLLQTVSASHYPDGRPVDLPAIIGYATLDDTGMVTAGQSFVVIIEFPFTKDAEAFEEHAINRILDLQDEWDSQSNNNNYHVEILAERSFDDEFARAIVGDIPLVPLVFTVMSIFTCLIFAKRDPVQSRALMGFGAVVAVLLAIMSGYGLLFIIGVPFTSMTQILPFIMFGIGLDDAFIITGEYARTDPKKDPVERIDETIQAVGLSIALTTITSVLAFGLGAMSSVPAVFWLCYYAFPTLAINFLYQVTFFVAIIVIDEKRVQDRRRDCCVCFSGPKVEENDDSQEPNDTPLEMPMADRVMLKYADILLRPWMKVLVLIGFAAMLGGFAYSTTLLEQEFNFVDVLPSDSYITEFFDAFGELYDRGSTFPQAHFRFVDQSDPAIQDQMETYVNELVAIDSVEYQPTFFWLRDFKKFLDSNQNTTADLAFNQQLDAFMEQPGVADLYGSDIFRDADGNVESSRVTFYITNVDIESVTDQVSVLEDLDAVTESQPVNQGKEDFAFFNYGSIYNIWEFYRVAVDELILTTITGVVAVTGVALVLVPHWSAALFVLPLISILYIDMLGFLQLAGAHVNAVSYISLVMSIGLLVDFVVHVLLRFYECEGTRDEKVRETLRTMGSSIMIGAVSTFLGVIPLAFSTSEIFGTIFNAFVGLVVLGSLHGLVLLPVVLSLIGPEECIRPAKTEPKQVVEDDEKPVKEEPSRNSSMAWDSSALLATATNEIEV
ncbi:Pick C1-like protein 1 [Seminavis robusta]|uniref:Pick C1-like protein 1 n=1 Tax=Seminavis robusta TaxID=568900 RepID=A0A9N8DHE4_9STRA|nr:Pick C1-like protein 1 [Seminavis robusta]|eukprot:Sro144_g066930.1 Pick C1-like protein 1 (934) ;mRNA; f:29529-32512